jgi:GDP-4-dehydro-6-deoxy-D-mannose reductase
MRVLITGASGFAGGYLARACASAGEEVLGISRSGFIPEGGGEGLSVDVRDREAVARAVRDLKPEVIYHLAALSSVGESWDDPSRTMRDNVAGSVAMLEAMRREASSARMVWVSSCQVYGMPTRLPVHEDAPQEPENPYAVSKSAGDMLAGVYHDAYGLDIIRARPFNHTGPGQQPLFIVSSLAHQAAEARLSGARAIRVVTGNPQTRRDFTDVRDVVRAYRLLAERAEAGVYNVSSGASVSAAEHVELLRELLAPIEVEHAVDPARVRAHEVMDLRGANHKIAAAVGWRPEIPLRQTVLEMIEWWERELAREPASTS